MGRRTSKSLVQKECIISFLEDCKTMYIFFQQNQKNIYSYVYEDLLCFWFSYINKRGMGAAYITEIKNNKASRALSHFTVQGPIALMEYQNNKKRNSSRY